jgi:predicted house-cleaning noncanonical NTP pyrophosphatase (MazG superfamily)
MKYDKAIRDRIPEIIRTSGSTCVVKQLADNEFLTYLEKKLGEELSEYMNSKSVIELVDLIEVIIRIAELRNITSDELEEIRLKKKDERGGFEKNYLLLETQNPLRED